MNNGPVDNENDKKVWKRFSDAAKPSEPSLCPGANTMAAYLDGMASSEEIEMLEKHLAGCDTCMRALIELRSLTQEYPMIAHESIKLRVKALMPARQQVVLGLPVRRTRPFAFSLKVARWAAIAAAIPVVSFAGFWIGRDCFHFQDVSSSLISSKISFGLFESQQYDSGTYDELMLKGGVP